MGKPKPESEYRNLAKQKGFEYLGPYPGSVLEDTFWQCSKGHKWETKYSYIQQGTGCPVCGRDKRSKKECDYHKLAESCGIAWVGELPKRTTEPTEWFCSCGQRWMGAYNTIKINKSRSCPKCAKKRAARLISLPVGKYKSLAAERGIEWIGPYPKNTKEKTQWRCKHGHVWSASYRSVKINRCPKCAGNHPKQPEDYHLLAEIKNLHWDGEHPKNVTDKTNWKCKKCCNKFKSTYDIINQSSIGCPKCARRQVSDKQRHTEKDYIRLAKKRGFIFAGPMVQKNNQKTWWVCSKGHKWDACYSHIQQGRGCPRCRDEWLSERRRLTQEAYQKRAKKFGVKWMGPPVKNTSEKTYWKCRCGNIWEATFYNNRGQCPECRFRKQGIQRRLKEDCYHALASERGFYFLGPYTGKVKDNTGWQCEYGHIWEASYNSIDSGKGCPVCNESTGERRIRLTLESWGIRYERQKQYKKCKHDNYLRFDFYFHIGKTHFLVEYDGLQHFKPIEFFGGKTAFKEQQKRDAIKNQFVRDHAHQGYVLIRIPFSKKQRIRGILRKHIIKHAGFDPLSLNPAGPTTPPPTINPAQYRQLSF